MGPKGLKGAAVLAGVVAVGVAIGFAFAPRFAQFINGLIGPKVTTAAAASK